VGRNVASAKHLDVGGFFSLELMPIRPPVKKFIQGIV
jgi:hypothetical protein